MDKLETFALDKVQDFYNEARELQVDYNIKNLKPNFERLRSLRKDMNSFCDNKLIKISEIPVVNSCYHAVNNSLSKIVGPVSKTNYSSFIYDIISYINHSGVLE